MTHSHTRASHDYTNTPASIVQAHIAHAIVPPTAPHIVGDVTLLPHQADAVVRLRSIIKTFHGALLADDVGLGKTYVALALAAERRTAHVIAPAALLPMWRHAIARAACTHVQLHSLHAFSSALPPISTRALYGDDFVIVDEAHHLRTCATKRYAAVAQFVADHDVLLLSATPLHNDARELRHLLALFAGGREDLLSPHRLAQLIVRRTQSSPHASRPRVCTHAPHDVPHDHATLSAILALPAPLPAHDGAVSGALIRLGLLRTWCSSDAALTHAVRKRVARGEALRQALLAGRHPTHAELRSWLVGDHEVQLAFPELLASHETESGALLEILEKHLAALRALDEHHRRTARGDVIRAQAIRDIRAQHPNVPIVAFSQFAQTVHALHRALADIAGVGSLTGTQARIASGPISRQHALANFAPVAQGRPPPPPHQAITLLITTDLLAEGVNLQDAGIVLHCDLPWTDALRQQRVGRCARIGSLHEVVHVYQLGPPTGSAHILKLSDRLTHKAQLAEQLVGAAAQSPARSAADVATRIRIALQSWSPVESYERAATSHMLVASVPARRNGFVALVHVASPAPANVLLTHLHGWRAARDDAPAVYRVLRQLENERAPAWRTTPPDSVANARRLIARWYRARELRTLFGDTHESLAPTQQRARARLAQVVFALPSLQRASLRTVIAQAHRSITSAVSVGAQHTLNEWVMSAELQLPVRWLREHPVVLQPHTNSDAVDTNPLESLETTGRPKTPRLRVAAILILCAEAAVR